MRLQGKAFALIGYTKGDAEYRVYTHDLCQASVGLSPHTACKVSEVCWCDFLESLLFRSLQLLHNVTIVSSLGKVGTCLASPCLPGPTAWEETQVLQTRVIFRSFHDISESLEIPILHGM